MTDEGRRSGQVGRASFDRIRPGEDPVGGDAGVVCDGHLGPAAMALTQTVVSAGDIGLRTVDTAEI